MSRSNSNNNLNFKHAERKHFAFSNPTCVRANRLLACLGVKCSFSVPAEVPDTSLRVYGLSFLSLGCTPSEAKSQDLVGNFCAYSSKGFRPWSQTPGQCTLLTWRSQPNDWKFLKPGIMQLRFALGSFQPQPCPAHVFYTSDCSPGAF